MDVIESGHWWQSGNGAAERLEAWLTAQHNALSCTAVANGTAALEIALRGFGIGPGDEVLVPATTFVSSATAVTLVGARPVPVDVDPETWCIDLDRAEEFVTPRTRALIVVHLAGQPADLAGARLFCDRWSLLLLEDSAQATTARWETHRVGTIGDATTFSFQAGKLLPGGEGGAVLVKADRQLARRIELLANCGRPRGSGAYRHEVVSTNARITEFSAATVLAHIEEYESLWARRNANAARLRASLATIDPTITLGPHPAVRRHDWYMFMFRVPAELAERGVDNVSFTKALAYHGIPSSVMFPPWHTVPAFRGAYPAGTTPVAEAVGVQGLWLHHRVLLDDTGPDDIALAVSRVLRESVARRAPEETRAN